MGQYPPYNGVYGIATHNSYWINRSDAADIGASGTQELISDQLLHDHVRGLEIDVHSEGAAPGQWKVYHTSDSEDFLGRFLEDYLEYLRNFQYAVPQHDVINIIIELKNVDPPGGLGDVLTPVHHNFDSNHTIEQFDDTFRRYLGPWLYTPGDFLRRSPGATTMVECAKAAGWPTLDDLRGKFIVSVLGNWSTAAYDWVSYATGDLTSRVAFPMQSVFAVVAGTTLFPLPGFPGGLPPDVFPAWFKVAAYGRDIFIKDIADDWYAPPSPAIDPAARQAAFHASLFWQFEPAQNLPANSFGLDRAKDFLANGGVIRCTDSFSYPDQLDRLAKGFQMVQTDYPWYVVNDQAPDALGIPTDPSRRLRDGSWFSGPPGIVSGAFHEPGTKFYGHTTPPAEIWAYTNVPAVSQRWWETTVSTTRHGPTKTEIVWEGMPFDPLDPLAFSVKDSYPRRARDNGTGAIRVQSEDGTDSVVIVRHKETQPGDSYYQEKVVVTVIVTKDGQEIAHSDFVAARYGPCKRDEDPNSGDVSPICVGSLIALAIDNHSNGSTATVFSAGKTAADDTPDWQWLAQWDFAQPLTRQGFSAFGDVLFAGPRTTDSLNSLRLPAKAPDFVRLHDLSSHQVFHSGRADDACFVDLTQPFVPCPTAKIVLVKRGLTWRCQIFRPLSGGEQVTFGFLENGSPDVSQRPDISQRIETIQWSVVGADIQGRTDEPKLSVKVHDNIQQMSVSLLLTDDFDCKTLNEVSFKVYPPGATQLMEALCLIVEEMHERIIDLPSALWHKLGPDPDLNSVVARLRQQHQKELFQLAELAKQYEKQFSELTGLVKTSSLPASIIIGKRELAQLQLVAGVRR